MMLNIPSNEQGSFHLFKTFSNDLDFYTGLRVLY